MRKLVITLILVVLGGGGYYAYQKMFAPEPEKPQVIQATVSQGNIQEVVKATGTLQPLRISPVGSQVSGKVKRLYVDFNSIVKQGQLIAELDDELLATQVELQEANVARQEGDISNQEVQLENDERNLERSEALFAKGLVNQQQIDAARLQVKTRATQLESAKKQLLTGRANLRQAQLNLSYAKIYSPLDGVVVNRLVDEGQTVQSSMNVAQFFTLATDLRTLKLQAWVDEAEIGKIRPGQDVVFTVDTYAPERFSGTVDAVRLNAQNQSNVVTYPVWITVPNPELKLRPSMTATIDIILSTANNVVRIPMSATRFRPTTEMWTALGLQPPAGGQGRAGGRGQAQGGQPGAAPDAGRQAQAGQPAAEGAGQQARGDRPQGAQAGGDRQARAEQAQPGAQAGQAATAEAGRRGGGAGGRGGFGRGANLSPEDRQRMAAQFGAGGGRTGGRGRGAGNNATATPVDLGSADQIDELWADVPRPRQNLNVWTWDEPNKKLTQVPIVVGVSDGQWGELVSGDVKVGQQLVTQVVIPISSQQRQQSLFGGQQRGGGPGRGGPQQVQPGGGGQRGGGGFGGGGGGFDGGGGGGGGGRGGGGVRF